METVADLNARHERSTRARTYVKYARCLAITRGKGPALQMLEEELGPHNPFLPYFKAAVTAHSSSTAAALAEERISGAFVELQREGEIPARLGAVPAAPRTRIPVFDRLPEASWVAWGQPIPATSMRLSDESSEPTEIAGILGISREWLRASGDPGLNAFERALLSTGRGSVNNYFCDDQAAVSGTRPAGILNGISSLGGGSPSAIADDVLLVWTAVRGGEATRPRFITSPDAGLYFSTLDHPMFREAGPLGGRLAGVPLLTTPSAGAKLILVDGDSIILSDQGLSIETTSVAAVQMDDAPSSPANMVAAFQTDTSFLKMRRMIWWAKAYEDAAAYIDLPLNLGSPA